MWRSSFKTHSHLCSALVKEREVAGEAGGSVFDQSFGFYLLSFWGIYIEEAFVGFFPLGFSQDKSVFFLCGCACLSFSDLLAYGYAVIMLNVLRSYITIKQSTWYQSHPKRRHCAVTEYRTSYFLGLSQQSISKRRIG